MFAAASNILTPTAVFTGRNQSMPLGREGLLTHSCLSGRNILLCSPQLPQRITTWLYGQPGVESGCSFILSRRRPARKKVAGESFRVTNGCDCLLTGGEYSVCVLPLSLACLWPVAKSSWNSLALNPSATSESFSALGGKQWQPVICWHKGLLWGLDCKQPWEPGSILCLPSMAHLCAQVETQDRNSIFPVGSAECSNFLLGEEIKGLLTSPRSSWAEALLHNQLLKSLA